MTEPAEQPAKPRSESDSALLQGNLADSGRRVYLWWGVGFGSLLALGLVCWLLVGPVLAARAAVARCQEAKAPYREYLASKEVRALGGPRSAAWRLALYLRMPTRVAPHRDTAVLMLGECGPSAAGALARCLADDRNDPMDRYHAVQGLGKIGGPEAAEVLLAASKVNVPWIGAAPLYALAELRDSRAVEPLAACAAAGDSSAAYYLGKVGNEAALAHLLKLLASTNGQVRRGAARALGELADPRTMDALVAATRERSDSMNSSGGWLYEEWHGIPLGDIHGAEGAMGGGGAGCGQLPMTDDYASARWYSARALGRIGDRRAVAPLLAMLKDDPKDETAPYYVAEALARLKAREGVELLAALLERRDLWPQPGWMLVRALGELGDERATGALRKALVDQKGDGQARALILWALWRVGEPGVLERCRKDLGADEALARRAAAEALGMMGERSAAEPLISALRDADPRVRCAAAKGLGLLGNPEAVPALAATVDDPAEAVRFWAIVALGWLGDERAVPALEKVFAGQSQHYAAFWALRQIEARSAGERK